MTVCEVTVLTPLDDYPYTFFVQPLIEFDAIHTDGAKPGYLPNGRRFDGPPEIPAWCEDQFGQEGQWMIAPSACHIAFKRRREATAFKLRWCSPKND